MQGQQESNKELQVTIMKRIKNNWGAVQGNKRGEFQ